MAGTSGLPSYLNPMALDAAALKQNETNADRAEINREEFFSLMIAELQNQDPLEPLSNSELLGQLSQMEMLNASTRTADGIESLIGSLKAQQLALGSAFIGTVVRATDDAGAELEGLVGRVSTAGDQVNLTLQIPVVDAQGKMVTGPDGNVLTREVTVALDKVEEIVAPGLADFGTTIVEETTDTGGEEESAP